MLPTHEEGVARKLGHVKPNTTSHTHMHQCLSKGAHCSYVSLNLIPSMYSTLCEYARTSAFKASILNICSVVTSVQRPCLMM